MMKRPEELETWWRKPVKPFRAKVRRNITPKCGIHDYDIL